MLPLDGEERVPGRWRLLAALLTRNSGTGQHRCGFTPLTLKGGGHGSVLKIHSGVTMKINTLTITGGNAGMGGGIFVNTGSSLTLNHVTVSGSAASFASGGGQGNGGGIFSNGAVTLNDSTVSGNTAAAVGGGIFSQGNGTVTLNGSATITGNTAASDGGGIFNLCGTVNGAVAGAGGNVFGNKPDNIVSVCA